jgi:hypothetical protein
MNGQQVNQVSARIIFVLSVMALMIVLIGFTQPPQPDEGALAHIFQITIVLLAPMMLLFLGTADWNQPLRSARRLVLPAGALVLAFAALYYLEHFR